MSQSHIHCEYCYKKLIRRRPSNIILEKPKYFPERTHYESQTRQLRWKPIQKIVSIGVLLNSSRE